MAGGPVLRPRADARAHQGQEEGLNRRPPDTVIGAMLLFLQFDFLCPAKKHLKLDS